MPDPHPHLIDKALSALISFMQAHKDGPVTKRETELLRFALAFLYQGGDREAYDTFWREARRETDGTEAGEFGRLQSMRSAFQAIARANGDEEGW